jgi:UDP-GlcNAc3NAcA epimerase
MKIVTIIGARPQFIKAAMVTRAIQDFNQAFRGSRSKNRIWEILVHTGQHYDYLMDKVFFEELDLPKPDDHLGVGSGSHGKQTALMLERIEPILLREKPDGVLVYGDTNSTLAGALAAAKLNIPIAHVESGLRSYDRNMPEEINRLLTDHLSTILFCPTDEAIQNLKKEGIKNGKGKLWVKNVGDVMHDSIVFYSKVAEQTSTILHDLKLFSSSGSLTPNSELQTPNFNLQAPNSELQTPNYYLATLHRAENTDDPKRLRSILRAFDKISKTAPVILPLHPRTKKRLKSLHLQPGSKNVRLIEPVSYLNMLMLERHARAILTDSGGVQKEAYWLRVPCITLRDVTEWGYTIQEGWNTVSGWKTAEIVRAVQRMPDQKKTRRRGNEEKQTASEKIVRLLFEYLGNRKNHL